MRAISIEVKPYASVVVAEKSRDEQGGGTAWGWAMAVRMGRSRREQHRMGANSSLVEAEGAEKRSLQGAGSAGKV